MNYRITFLCLVGLAVSLQSNAQVTTISKSEAVALALENNYGIKISNNSLKIAENNKDILNSGYLPTLTGNAGADFRKTDSDTEFQNPPPNNVDGAKSKSYNASIGTNYLLFNGFARQNTFKLLKEQYNLTQLQARQVIENTLLTLFTAYYEVARLSENETIQKKNLQVSKQRLLRANYAYEYGQSTGLDVLNAEVDVNNDSISYLDSKLLLVNSKRDLNVVLGRDVNTSLQVSTDIEFILGLALEDMQQKSQNSNATLLLAKKNIELGEYNIKINKATYMPNVALTSSYAWNKSDNDPTNQFSPISSLQKGLNAGINLSWDIFDGGSTKTRVKNAKIQLENNEISFRQEKELLSRNLNNAWETYQNRLFTLQVQGSSLETNKVNFERSNEQYKLGQITSIDFRQAQLNLNNAELNLSQAKYNAKNAELLLLQLSGDLLNIEF